MEPRIQYARAKDRVSIAFWTLGEGFPIRLEWVDIPDSETRFRSALSD